MRPSKKEHYLNIAREVAQRSTCFRRKFGAIIVKDDVIVATGYVGAPRKTQDCFERGECLRDKMGTPHGQRYELCRSVHAEQNCVSENSLTILPTGEIEKIKKVHSPLLALNTANFKIQSSKGERFEEDKKEIIKITTIGNHEIEVSPDHLMFVADKSKILKTKKAKDLTSDDLLPFAAKILVKGNSQLLPEISFNTYRLTKKGREIFQKYLREIGWQKLADECGFSIIVIARLRKGKGIEKKNKEKILRFYPRLASFFEGLNFHKIKIPRKTSPDFCQIAGYFLGDGSLSKNFVALYDESRETLRVYQNLAKKVFHTKNNIRKASDRDEWILYLCSYRLWSLFLKLNFGKRESRQIPSIFYKVDNTSLAGFLRGYFDAEGTVGERAVHLSSQRKELLEIVRLLLLRFGIFSSIYRIKRKKEQKNFKFQGYKNNPYFSLEITGSDLDDFIRKIGFSHPQKLKKIKNLALQRKNQKKYSFSKLYFKQWFRGNFPTRYFPLLRDYRTEVISKDSAKKILRRFERFGYNQKNLFRLKNLVENLVFLKIKKIKKIRKQTRMIDYFVPKYNSFLVNGFIVHNCIINAARTGVSLLTGDMYIWGEDGKGNRINTSPCFICKKMIINAGLNRVICSTKNGGMKTFNIQDWVKDWQEKDILDDKDQYGND